MLFLFRYFNMIEINSVAIFIVNGMGIVVDVTFQCSGIVTSSVVVIVFTSILIGKFFIPANQDFPFFGMEKDKEP